MLQSELKFECVHVKPTGERFSSDEFDVRMHSVKEVRATDVNTWRLEGLGNNIFFYLSDYKPLSLLLCLSPSVKFATIDFSY